MNPRTARALGVTMILVAAAGGVVLFVTRGDGSDSPDPSNDGAPMLTTTTAPPVDDPVDLGGGWVLDVVGEVPGATAMSAVDGGLRVTDAATGSRYDVALDGAVEGPRTFGSLSRRDRSVPSPDSPDRWVAEATQLHRIDDDGEILDTVTLEVPGAVTAVDGDAVWLTVSGVPGPHDGTGNTARSVVQRVDRATLDVVARPLEDPATFRFALGDDAAWVTVGRTVYRLDPTTLEPAAETELAAPAADLLVDAGGAVLVVVGGDAPELVTLDPTDLSARSRVDLGAGSVGDATFVGDRLGRVGEVWILRPDDDALLRVTTGSGEVDEIGLESPRRIEVDDQEGVWVLSGAADGTLLRATPTEG